MTLEQPNTFIHGKCYHTSKAIEFLRNGKPGDTVSREEMARIIDRPCNPNTKHGKLGYSNVNSAIRAVERDHQVVWRWARELQVWKCFHDDEKVGCASRHNSSARRFARRSKIVSVAVNQEKLSPEEKITHNVNIAVTAMYLLAGSGRAKKRLAQIGNPTVPTFADIKKLFVTKKKQQDGKDDTKKNT